MSVILHGDFVAIELYWIYYFVRAKCKFFIFYSFCVLHKNYEYMYIHSVSN